MSLKVSIRTAANVTPRAALEKEDCNKIETEVGQFSEGGTAAWCTVIGGMLVLFCGFGYTTSFGVYQDFYTLHYLTNESSSAISWIGSINAFLGTAFGMITGALHDHGYFYHMLIGGSLLQSFTLFMLSLTQPGQYYAILLAQGIGLGIGQGMVYVPTMAAVSQHFRQRRTLAMSLVVSGTSVGSIVHPIMLNYLFNSGVGFTNGVRISAAFISTLLFIACLLMRVPLGASKYTSDYLTVGRRIIHDIPFCIMSISALCIQIGFLFPFFYLQLDSIKHGNSETFSFYSLVLLNGGSLIGRVSSGFITSWVSVPWLVIIATSVCGTLNLGMIGLSGIPTVVVLGIIYGCFGGIYIGLLAPLMALLTNDLSELGARMGIAYLFAGVGSLLSGPISGALLTSEYKWWQPALFAGLIVLTGSSLLVVMQLVQMRRQNSTATGGGPELAPEAGQPPASYSETGAKFTKVWRV